jgi:hypothetical protein
MLYGYFPIAPARIGISYTKSPKKGNIFIRNSNPMGNQKQRVKWALPTPVISKQVPRTQATFFYQRSETATGRHQTLY